MHLGITAFLTDRSMPPGAFARAVEERGFFSFYLPEHTHLPVRNDQPPSLVDGVKGEDYRRSLDPFVSLAAAAEVTDRILLGTGVSLVAQHDPIVLAKQIATLDLLAGGRFVLGVGYGWNREEAADHGVDFSQRRALLADKLRCMGALWSEERPEYHGTHVELPACHAWPKPIQQPRVRTLFGGGAGSLLFAAIAELGDGWMPIGGAGLATALPELRRVFAAAGRDPGALQVVAFGSIPEEGKLEHFRALGVSEVVLRVPAGPSGEMLRVLDRYTGFLPAVSSGP
jgi:probable F420-dependent oxidoreductase